LTQKSSKKGQGKTIGSARFSAHAQAPSARSGMGVESCVYPLYLWDLKALFLRLYEKTGLGKRALRKWCSEPLKSRRCLSTPKAGEFGGFRRTKPFLAIFPQP
jgi:hypothetical protein